MNTKIVNMKNKQSVRNPHAVYAKGFALYVEDKGFLSLDGKNVYIPQGGRNALKSILLGGLDHYSFVEC